MREEELIDTLYSKHVDVLWPIHTFQATPAFQEVHPLFDEEVCILEAGDEIVELLLHV